MNPILEQRGLESEKRKAGEVETTAIVGKDRPDFLLLETFVHGDGLVMVNHVGRAEKLVSAMKKAPEDILGNRAGLVAELRFGPVLLALRQLDLDQFVGSGPQSFVVKAMVAKAMLALGQLDLFRVEVVKVDAGLRLKARLALLFGSRAQP